VTSDRLALEVALLPHFHDPFPVVEHYEPVDALGQL
jgi:hypothetical protein